MSMETILGKAIESAPSLALVVVVVWLFIKYLERREASAAVRDADQAKIAAARDAEQAKILAALNLQSVNAAKEAHEVILGNTMANVGNSNQLSANTSATTRMTQSIEQMNHSIQEMNRNLLDLIKAQRQHG